MWSFNKTGMLGGPGGLYSPPPPQFFPKNKDLFRDSLAPHFKSLVSLSTWANVPPSTLKGHVHPSSFAPLSFCCWTVHLLNAVFWLAIISQVTIFNYAKFLQCTQGDNGSLNSCSSPLIRCEHIWSNTHSFPKTRILCNLYGRAEIIFLDNFLCSLKDGKVFINSLGRNDCEWWIRTRTMRY